MRRPSVIIKRPAATKAFAKILAGLNIITQNTTTLPTRPTFGRSCRALDFRIFDARKSGALAFFAHKLRPTRPCRFTGHSGVICPVIDHERIPPDHRNLYVRCAGVRWFYFAIKLTPDIFFAPPLFGNAPTAFTIFTSTPAAGIK